MLEIKKDVVYKAFGFTIKSEISFPELPNVQGDVKSIDIEISISDLTTQWIDYADKHSEIVINENLVMFKIPEIAIFSIKEGRYITASPFIGADEDEIRLFILGTCMGAILMQRKVYPLHGSAVAINGKAYAFIGESGAGKSTLASAFLNQGYQLLSDDVIAVTFSYDESTPMVIPSYPQQKLWQDSLTSFGMEVGHYRSIYGREEKYCIPVTTQYFQEPLPLAGVFELVKTEGKNVEIQRIEKLERFHTLFCHTYRNFIIPGMGLMDWHFKTSARIVNQMNLFRLSRPASGFFADQLVSLIIETI